MRGKSFLPLCCGWAVAVAKVPSFRLSSARWRFRCRKAINYEVMVAKAAVLLPYCGVEPSLRHSVIDVPSFVDSMAACGTTEVTHAVVAHGNVTCGCEASHGTFFRREIPIAYADSASTSCLGGAQERFCERSGCSLVSRVAVRAG